MFREIRFCTFFFHLILFLHGIALGSETEKRSGGIKSDGGTKAEEILDVDFNSNDKRFERLVKKIKKNDLTDEDKVLKDTLKFSHIILKEYNSLEKVAWIKTMDWRALRYYKANYRQVPGLPRFLHDFLYREINEGFYMIPEAFEFISCWEFNNETCVLLNPNPSYNNADFLYKFKTEYRDLKRVRFLDGGFSLTAWFFHSDQLPTIRKEDSKSSMSKEEITENFFTLSDPERRRVKSLPQYSKSKIRDKVQVEAHFGRQNKDIRKLKSILNLTKEDVPFLEDLRKKILLHLKKIYNVDRSSDQINMYFHFPYARATVGLHLHIRVNQRFHPLEARRSFDLEEIIEVLKNENHGGGLIHWGIQKMIHKRVKEGFYTGLSTLKDGIPKGMMTTSKAVNFLRFEVEEVENPFKVEVNEKGEPKFQAQVPGD